MPVMALDWQTDVPAPAGNLEIRKVDVTGDKAGFADAYRVIHESFGGPDIMNDLFVPDDGTVIPYVAYLDGKPVSGILQRGAGHPGDRVTGGTAGSRRWTGRKSSAPSAAA